MLTCLSNSDFGPLLSSREGSSSVFFWIFGQLFRSFGFNGVCFPTTAVAFVVSSSTENSVKRDAALSPSSWSNTESTPESESKELGLWISGWSVCCTSRLSNSLMFICSTFKICPCSSDTSVSFIASSSSISFSIWINWGSSSSSNLAVLLTISMRQIMIPLQPSR